MSGVLESSVCFSYFVFFFKQKTAYEVRISDWSSDVCSSDLPARHRRGPRISQAQGTVRSGSDRGGGLQFRYTRAADERDRKSVVEGRSVSVRVDLGGRRCNKHKKQHSYD